jgi:ABC-type multidrug transport system fused ATPase/permease subunit
MDSDKSEPIWYGYFLGITMFLCSFLFSLLTAQVGRISCSTKVKMRLCINASIYNKILRLRKIDLKDFSTGKIFNLISIDSATFVQTMDRLSNIWSAPVRLVLGAYLMYQVVGYLTFISLGAWVIFIIIMSLFARLTKKHILAKLEVTDRRVKFINEILDGIKSIKFYAWEECLIEEIEILRQEEVSILKKLERLETLFLLRALVGGWICLVTLFTSRLMLQHKSFTSEDMFFILSVIELITVPMRHLQMVVQEYMMVRILGVSKSP